LNGFNSRDLTRSFNLSTREGKYKLHQKFLEFPLIQANQNGTSQQATG